MFHNENEEHSNQRNEFLITNTCLLYKVLSLWRAREQPARFTNSSTLCAKRETATEEGCCVASLSLSSRITNCVELNDLSAQKKSSNDETSYHFKIIVSILSRSCISIYSRHSFVYKAIIISLYCSNLFN